MSNKMRFRKTLRYMRAHWPIFIGLYSVLVFAVLFIGLSLALGWYSFIPFSLAIMLVVTYFLISFIYVAYQLHDAPGGTAAEILISLAQNRPGDHVVCIDLGLRETAVRIAQHMTTGVVTVIDLYNPQSNTNASLRRGRDRARKPPTDPRLNWIDGSIELLPLPDRSVCAVYMNQVLSEYWHPEERNQLLEEVHRILIPEGRLLVAEPIRAQHNLLLAGVVTYFRPTATQWSTLLAHAGFIIQRQENARGVLYCARADKPSPAAGKQMQLNLEYI